MDLNTVTARLERGWYSEAADCLADIDQVDKNRHYSQHGFIDNHDVTKLLATPKPAFFGRKSKIFAKYFHCCEGVE